MDVPSISHESFGAKNLEAKTSKKLKKKKVTDREGIPIAGKIVDPRALPQKEISREDIPPSGRSSDRVGSTLTETATSAVSSTRDAKSESLFLEDGVVTREIFASLLPASIIDAPRGSKEAWVDFDESTLDTLIDAFENDRITTIITRDGTFFNKINLTSFETSLYKTSEDLEKTRIIANAFARYFTDSEIDPDSLLKIQNTLADYVDFIGVNQSNIRKILQNSDDTKDILTKDIWGKRMTPFLNRVSKKMQSIIDRDVSEVPTNEKAREDQLVVTTTSSGGAHISIARVITETLRKQEIDPFEVNESELDTRDKCFQCIGIPRKDIFNKISQQSGKMSYGKKLKKLDDLLASFIPDNRMKEIRKKVGDSNMIMSTSHHPENIRLVAEKKARVSFQVCDFGELPDKFHKIADTVTKYNLSGIIFYAPSEHSSFKIEEVKVSPGNYEGRPRYTSDSSASTSRAASSVSPSSPSIEAGDLEDPMLTNEGKKQKISQNYSHFVRVFQYPVHEAFTQQVGAAIEDRQRMKASFGEAYNVHFRPEAKLWVMTMGSQGVGGILETYIDQIIDGSLKAIKSGQKESIDIAILTGGNQVMWEVLEKRFNTKIEGLSASESPDHILILKNLLRFHPVPRLPLEKVAELGKVCDAFLSKPGGGTAAEALIGEFPMVIHREKQHTWEFGNIEELTRSGAEEMHEGENFYDVATRARTGKAERAKKAGRAPDPLKEPDKCVSYSLDILWRMQQAKKFLEQYFATRSRILSGEDPWPNESSIIS